jgi:hypothetical protein
MSLTRTIRWFALPAMVVLPALLLACSPDRPGRQVIHVIDKDSNKPIAGVVVVAVWNQAEFSLEHTGESHAIRVYETTTGADGIAIVPAFSDHSTLWRFLHSRPPHIVLIKAGWMPATSWDARWQTETVFQPWDDSDQAGYDLAGFVNTFCEFKDWYKVSPDQLPLFRRELGEWERHFPSERTQGIVRDTCMSFQ